MPQLRKVIFSKNEYYHVYNRSIGKVAIFTTKWEIDHFKEILEYCISPKAVRLSQFNKCAELKKRAFIRLYPSEPYVKVLAYAIMPTHFHLLLKQLDDQGIQKYVSKIQNSYAKYFNKKEDRDGGLFKSPFQAKHIPTNELLLHISRYIHLNPVTDFIASIDQLPTLNLTSYPNYAGNKIDSFVDTSEITTSVGSNESYLAFCQCQEEYQKNLAHIKQYLPR